LADPLVMRWPVVQDTLDWQVLGAYQPGDLALLLLRQDPKFGWQPTDRYRPFVPVALGSVAAAQGEPDMDAAVIRAVVASLADAGLRGHSLDVLKDLRHPLAEQAMEPLIADPDRRVRDLALYGMLVNQRVDLMPQVLALAAELTPDEERHGACIALWAMGRVASAEMRPYLHALLRHRSSFSRVSAYMALDAQDLIDVTTIPYLMLGLRTPGLKEWSYMRLRHFAPSLPNYNLSYPDSVLNAAVPRAWAWWRDSLAGRVVEPRLHEALSYPDALVRRKVLAALQQVTDRSSVPPLLLALEDPDESVRYGAYTLLHRLLPELGPAQPIQRLRQDPRATLAPLWAWWTDEMLQKHLQQAPAG
jgi:hypothetical protein